MTCQYCNKELTEKDGRKKTSCRSCYNKIYYFKNWEKLMKKYKKRGTTKKDYSYYKDYLERNPDKKQLLHIRQQTYHKYGKAKSCSKCGEMEKVQHHHFTPYDVDNFIDLCINCHKKNYHRKEIPKELKKRISGDSQNNEKLKSK